MDASATKRICIEHMSLHGSWILPALAILGR
jgi:hypothetical protein